MPRYAQQQVSSAVTSGNSVVTTRFVRDMVCSRALTAPLNWALPEGFCTLFLLKVLLEACVEMVWGFHRVLQQFLIAAGCNSKACCAFPDISYGPSL